MKDRPATAQKGVDRRAILPPGSKAPLFNIKTTADQKVSLMDFRGQPVIVAFYPDQATLKGVWRGAYACKRLGKKNGEGNE